MNDEMEKLRAERDLAVAIADELLHGDSEGLGWKSVYEAAYAIQRGEWDLAAALMADVSRSWTETETFIAEWHAARGETQ